MGFRNPITSLDRLDTTGGNWGGDAGVRIAPSPPGGSAVVELQTGYLDRAATVTAAGGGSAGSALRLDGGATLGANAPTFALNLEQSAIPGVLSPAARLAGATTLDVGGAQLTGATGRPVPALPFTWNDATWNNYGAGLENVYFRFDPIASRVYATGLCKSTAGPYASGWKVLTITDAKYRPGAPVWVPVAYGGGVAHGGAYVQPSGLFVLDVIQAGYSPPAGTAVHLSFSWAVAGT